MYTQVNQKLRGYELCLGYIFSGISRRRRSRHKLMNHLRTIKNKYQVDCWKEGRKKKHTERTTTRRPILWRATQQGIRCESSLLCLLCLNGRRVRVHIYDDDDDPRDPIGSAPRYKDRWFLEKIPACLRPNIYIHLSEWRHFPFTNGADTYPRHRYVINRYIFVNTISSSRSFPNRDWMFWSVSRFFNWAGSSAGTNSFLNVSLNSQPNGDWLKCYGIFVVLWLFPVFYYKGFTFFENGWA